MKTISTSLFVMVVLLFACTTEKAENSTEHHTPPDQPQVETIAFDSLRAASLGADDYGMRSYVMAFLKAGENRSQDDSTRMALQRAHLDNIGRLAEEEKLALAGPFLDDGELRGIYVFAVSSIEEAEELTATDPAIQAGSLVMELHPWYGSAALMEVNEIHQRIARVPV